MKLTETLFQTRKEFKKWDNILCLKLRSTLIQHCFFFKIWYYRKSEFVAKTQFLLTKKKQKTPKYL